MALFQSHLGDARSLLDLARILGSVCLDQGGRLTPALADPLERKLIRAIAGDVERSSTAAWESVIAEPDSLSSNLGAELASRLAKADASYPLDCLAVLRGLCPRLHDLFEGVGSAVVLGRGMPIPFATRPVHKLFEATTYQGTKANGGLLSGCAARLFEYSSDEQLRVAIDYRPGFELDQLCWGRSKRLPKIATIHPPGSTKLQAEKEAEGRLFFDARPEAWDPEGVLDLMRAVADIEIGLLPELSVGDIEVIERALAKDPDSFPRMVVAGSIHRREEGPPEIRSNECRVYLAGRQIGSGRKQHAYEARELNGEKLSPPAVENLSLEQKTVVILSGVQTRMAVAICADLLDDYLPFKLQVAGVNLMLAPIFTPKPGSFSGAALGIAANCQGVAVLANAPPADASTPFHGIAAVPRAIPAAHTAMYPLPETTPSEVAVIDPNLPMNDAKAIVWR
jgi:hypothetical protein